MKKFECKYQNSDFNDIKLVINFNYYKCFLELKEILIKTSDVVHQKPTQILVKSFYEKSHEKSNCVHNLC